MFVYEMVNEYMKWSFALLFIHTDKTYQGYNYMICLVYITIFPAHPFIFHKNVMATLTNHMTHIWLLIIEQPMCQSRSVLVMAGMGSLHLVPLKIHTP